VVRYVLETCSTTPEALADPQHALPCAHELQRDRAGQERRPLRRGPPQPRPARPHVVHSPVCTNFQQQVEWDEYAAFTQTLQRNDELMEDLLRDENVDRAQLLDALPEAAPLPPTVPPRLRHPLHVPPTT
jgi:hypothetical protein